MNVPIIVEATIMIVLNRKTLDSCNGNTANPMMKQVNHKIKPQKIFLISLFILSLHDLDLKVDDSKL